MRFEDIRVGDCAAIVHTITSGDIEAFVNLTGDDNKLHTNKVYAANTSFKKPVAHGMLSASFISTLIGTKIPGDGALWYEQNLEFLLPVRVGDEITARAEVIKKIERLKAIELKTEVFNQHKQKVINGIAKVKIVENSMPAAADGDRPLGNNALIIGATGGIGSALARKLATEGLDLLLHFHANKTKAVSLKNELEAAFGNSVFLYQANIADDKEVDEMFHYIRNRMGPLNKIVHAATGPLPTIPFDSLEWRDFSRHFEVHVQGLLNMVKSFLRINSDVKYGKIVAISSQVTDQPAPNLTAYTTAKSAMEGLVRSLALDLSKHGIRVNMVSPGLTDTDLNADWSEKAKLLVAAQTPLRRIATAEDVANAIAYLLSQESDFLTGETIRVNGGMTMK